MPRLRTRAMSRRAAGFAAALLLALATDAAPRSINATTITSTPYVTTDQVNDVLGVIGGARAQTCGMAENIRQQLAGRYSESRVLTGLTPGGLMFELWSSAEGATWTALVTSPGGTTCITASGKNLERADQITANPQDHGA